METENTKLSKIAGNIKSLSKLIFAMLLILLAYLFVLNDRYYIDTENFVIIDKWTKEVLECNIDIKKFIHKN